MARGSGVRDRIRNLFLGKLGKVITRQQIIEASKDPLTGVEPENWHQRLSELRTDEGYTIWASRDMESLRPGEYMMPHANRREIAGKRVRPTPQTWKVVLERAGDRCEWREAGEYCGLHAGAIDPIGGGRVKLTPDHMSPHSVNPNSDPQDAAQWQALCGRHQVTKKNYWDNATGKLNIYAIIQAASMTEKREAFRFLLEYFGYTFLESGKIVKNEK
ncbi:restriction endonuclease [Beijerinckiaceae bacterium]|nr:restriction endonuclease [Beijerinckiaceae bacterium]